MRWLSLTIIFICSTVALGEGKRPSVRITLREKVTIANSTVQLGDIAEVTAIREEGEKQIASLQTLPIAPSPLPRYQRVITAGEVATKLAQAGWRSGDFVLDGAKQVLVTRSGRNLTATELEVALQKSLNTNVKLLLPPPPIVLPDGELTVQAEMPTSPRTILPVTLLVNGQQIAMLKLLVQIHPVTNTNAVTQLSDLPISRPAHLTVFPPADYVVRRRQTVRLIARVGNVLVEAQGTALQDGKVGDEVMVAVSWSKTPLKGIVSGEREVTVAAW
ncbi:MAG: flagella basal body P-ring formation protein FlgA [Armatimonadetes bacterium]|nr:flagella basal body P-ring formation protein FlgA [Armatimonadota bacterium]MDW8027445.1 flagella basal body P-ring formation protein FlgA [Armatimonadota bacterium]